MSTHAEALSKIMKICHESSQYSRRMQTVHEIAMLALGLTYNQRLERHTKAMQRSEKCKEESMALGLSKAKKNLRQTVKDEPQDEFYDVNASVIRKWIA